LTDHHNPSNDDELIARLRASAGPEKAQHDPLFDLPVARQVDVHGDEGCPDRNERCNAKGRAPAAVQGYFNVEVTEPVSCELRAGHEGGHRASFTRSRVMHRWHALEWPDRKPDLEPH